MRTFICRHCGVRRPRNPRLKGQQRYCGNKTCQQARKNSWERIKLKFNSEYKLQRQQSKKESYKIRLGHQYQKRYREEHPDYCGSNRKSQIIRNEKTRTSTSMSKIVKTDALSLESVVKGGFYVLYPYEKADTKKIVKTDALIVQMVASQSIEGKTMQNNL